MSEWTPPKGEIHIQYYKKWYGWKVFVQNIDDPAGHPIILRGRHGPRLEKRIRAAVEELTERWHWR